MAGSTDSTSFARSQAGRAWGGGKDLYLILNRLKNDGFVESEWVDAGTGHPRKYYWLTARKDRLREMARFWTQFSADLNALLSPASGSKEDSGVTR